MIDTTIDWGKVVPLVGGSICLVSVILYFGKAYIATVNLVANRAADQVEITPTATISENHQDAMVTAVVTPPETPSPTPTPALTINNENFSLDYDVPQNAQKKGTVRIPILTYHHIGPMPTAANQKSYFVTPEMFERQLQYLQKKNYKTLTSQQFIDQVKTGKNPTQKMVILTFDDGNKDNYDYAYPLLKKYGMTGIFYINTKKLKMTVTQIKQMSDDGMVIDSHTALHMDLTKVTDKNQLTSEIAGSKATIEKITGKKVYSISYPGCVFNSQVTSIAAGSGYKFGVSCGKVIDHSPKALFGMSRMHVYNDFDNFVRILSGYWEVSYNY